MELLMSVRKLSPSASALLCSVCLVILSTANWMRRRVEVTTIRRADRFGQRRASGSAAAGRRWLGRGGAKERLTARTSPGTSPASATGTPEPNQKIDPEANAKLWDASSEGDLSAAKDALERGASVHARDENGNTALMLAAFYGQEEVVRLLIERGAEVNTVNPAGRTPLMFAATFDDPGTVKVLLSHGAWVNVRDSDEQFTALMFAASEGHLDVVQLLLEHDADKTLVDVDGDTAADFARQNGHMKVVELLK